MKSNSKISSKNKGKMENILAHKFNMALQQYIATSKKEKKLNKF